MSARRWSFVVAVLVCAVIVAVLVARRPAIAPVDPPDPSQFSAEQIAAGARLASAGYCMVCHTAQGGAPYAGGYAMRTQFGTIYSTNITPDAETGIGNWSEAAFRRAMHEGVARDGAHLFPAFPYDHFTKLTDEDVAALYAFLMTQPAVRSEPPRNTVPFPLNVRLLQAGWKLLFFRPGRFEPRSDQGEEWNRGAYLAEGIAHCGACHTPRNLLGAEKRHQPYAGAAIDEWIAPPLDASNPSPVAWDTEELIAYLTSGITHYHGTVAGSMAPVTREFSTLPPEDVRAVAVYFASFGKAAQGEDRDAAVATALARSARDTGLSYDADARLYAAACASCHYNAGELKPLRPELALSSALHLDDPTNLIQVILHGIDAPDGVGGVVMPAFAGLSDADIVRLATYLRATRTDKPAWKDLEKKVAQLRATTQHEEQP